MAYAKKFQELHCWQSARSLTIRSYTLIADHRQLKQNYGFNQQLTRASLSIMNNIAEGFGRRSKKEFARFLDIAVASCAEVESMLSILPDIHPVPVKEVDLTLDLLSETETKAKALLKYLRKD